MKLLVLSDIHIGDPRLKNEDAIAELILKADYDELILNGDFLELWLWDYTKAIKKSKVVAAINSLKKPVVWVRGNHDPVSSCQSYLPKALVTNTYIEVVGSKRIMFLHGHQVYPDQNMGWYSKLAFKFNILLYRLFRIDMQRWWRNKKAYQEEVKWFREDIIDLYGKNVHNIVIGHTHVPAVQGKLYDGGSLLMTGHYIYIDDEDISIKRLRE